MRRLHQIAIRPAALAAVLALMLAIPARAGEIVLGGGAITPHLVSLRELRFVRVVKQQFDFSCGSAAIATLLSYSYDRPVSERDVFNVMFEKGNQAVIRKVGFSLLDMQTYLTSVGLHANGYKVGLDQVAKIGLPAVTLITTGAYNHFVVIRGIRDGIVLIGDSALGLRRVPAETFTQKWGGVIFVIQDDIDRGQAHFNDPRDWGLLPTGPLARGFDQQRSGLTSLFATMPIGNEF